MLRKNKNPTNETRTGPNNDADADTASIPSTSLSEEEDCVRELALETCVAEVQRILDLATTTASGEVTGTQKQ